MSSLHRILITSPLTVAGFESVVNLDAGRLPGVIELENFLGGLAGGNRQALLACSFGSVQASGNFTQTSTGAANDETLVVAGVTFTAKTSGATGNQWNRNNNVSISAANLAAALNASASVNIYVIASASLGVVTVKALQPGVLGNLVVINESCANTTVSGATLTGGTEGSVTLLDLR
jgi:hypothetical protein